MAAATQSPAPVMPPPPGITSNFVDPPTLMPTVIAVSVLVLTLMTLFVGARAYVKIVLLRKNHIEDWLCYGAWAGVVTYIGVMDYIEDYGFARHMWDVTPEMLMKIMYYLHIMYCLYSPVTFAAKLSVLLQIKRIFTTKERSVVWWVVWGSIIANAIFYTGLFFSYVFQCWPREKIWNPSVPGKCVSAVGSNLASGIINVVSDIETLVLPFWAIWHLNMPVKRKVGVGAVFAVGTLACVIGVVGIYYRVLLLRTKDFTWICTQAAMLVISEMAVVNIVGCFPSLPRFIRHIQGRSEGSRQQSYPSTDRRYEKKHMHSLAKYMSPGATLTKVGENTSDEHLELHTYSGEREIGISRGTKEGEDVELGSIMKTVRVEQTVIGQAR